MPLPLPNLDTRRWADLVEEGRALVPRHAPDWTDHNIHDPGITLVELFAWLAEQLIYRANRIPERHRRKFLALVGFPPHPPRPARAVLGLQLTALAGSRVIPIGTPFLAAASEGQEISFRATHATTLVEASLAAAQTFDGARFIDRARALRDGAPFAPLGADPRAPSPYDAERAPALYLGFDQALPVATGVTLWLHVAGAVDGERARLEAEARAIADECAPPVRDCAKHDCGDADEGGEAPSGSTMATSLLHHSARTAWEYLAADGWHALDASAGEIDDRTRAFTLDGAVRVTVPGAMTAGAIGAVATPRFWLRCRLVRGAFDETPILSGVTLNAVAVEQAREAWRRFPIAAGTVVSGAVVAGARARLAIRIDDAGVVRELGVLPATAAAPELLVLDFVAPTASAPGAIALPLAFLGTGTGLPEQRAALDDAPPTRDAIDVHTLEGANEWRAWTVRADLDASRDVDAHVALSTTDDALVFGDGVRGRVPPDGAAIVAAYRATLGAAGNVSGGRAWRLDDGPVARALLGADLATIAQATIVSRSGATRGADAEDVGHAAARAASFLWAHERLVDLCPSRTCATLDQLDAGAVRAREAPPRATTTLDVERIARVVPGTRVRRARAWAALDPVDVCLDASGTVTLVIVPALPARRPAPTAGLIRAVRRWLDRRRVLCTRLLVVGPTYLDVGVRATVQALRSADVDRVRDDVARALDAFLDPLAGGPAGRGWPFGRDVYRSEILQVIDGVSGVDHVLALTLSASADGEPREADCDNLCVPPTWLVAPAPHEIAVVGP
jgi:predicted phage baseplate assembly protein